jgi:hypothetical protein
MIKEMRKLHVSECACAKFQTQQFYRFKDFILDVGREI